MNTLRKGLAASIVAVLACLSSAAPASALSLQVRGGIVDGDQGDGSNIGVDVFFYEGRSFDFFAGFDSISASQTHDLSTTGGTVSATTDADTTAIMLGLRYKMRTESSWKPFLSFGIARFDTEFTHQAGLEAYYERPFEKTSTGMRLGLGVDAGFGDNWSIGLEGSLLTNVYYYEEGFFGGMRLLDKYGVATQLNLGLRYHFD